MKKIKSLNDIENFEGVKFLLRVDFNVPIKNGIVCDDFRIRMALPTINHLLSKKAKVIIISHIEIAPGLVDSRQNQKATLKPVFEALKKMDIPISFVNSFVGVSELIDNKLNNGECVLLENLRFFDGEKNNDPKFSKELSSLADIYINEAFSVSHRNHASIVGVPKLLPSYAGLQFKKEINNLSLAFHPEHPFLFILGGAKFETKLPLIEKYLNIADDIFIGGALANDALKAKGVFVGNSKISKSGIDLTSIVNQKKVILPTDVVVQEHAQKELSEIKENDCIYDIGNKSLEILKEKIDKAKFILWNGPLGLYEEDYQDSTLDLAKMISDSTSNGKKTIVGGGDTLSAIEKLDIFDKFSFVSTGGGAMLGFLANGTLPGIEALFDFSLK